MSLLEHRSEHIAQSGNTVLGDQAAGNIYKPTIYEASRSGPMRSLIERYRSETKDDREFRTIVEKLKRWAQPPSGDVIGLAEKLTNGGRADLLGVALEAKEQFSKTLLKHEYSPAAQEIAAFLLAKVHQKFCTIVRSKIARGASADEVDKLIAVEILDRVEDYFEENPLGLTPEDVTGMLFWLTGNCHLNWTTDANLHSRV